MAQLDRSALNPATQRVQKRLGRKPIEMTLSTYAYALPPKQKDAAARLGAILHG